MKRTTVRIHLSGLAQRQEVPGYASEIDGIPVVVHRSAVLGGWFPSPSDWTVTEPRSGFLIWDGVREPGKPRRYTRAYALERAARKIADNGGRAAVERVVAKALAREGS